MEVRELICINCPLGCPLTVRIEGENIEVSGNTCNRGIDYAQKEVFHPTRIVTSTVRVTEGELGRVPVKTEHDIPKGRIFDCMEEIRKAAVAAPVSIGQVIIPDCAGTGVSIIATRNIKRTV